MQSSLFSNTVDLVHALNAFWQQRGMDFAVQLRDDIVTNVDAWLVSDARMYVHSQTTLSPEMLCFHAIGGALAFHAKCCARMNPLSSDAYTAMQTAPEIADFVSAFLETGSFDWDRIWGLDVYRHVYSERVNCLSLEHAPVTVSDFQVLRIPLEKVGALQTVDNAQLFHRVDGRIVCTSHPSDGEVVLATQRQLMHHFLDHVEEKRATQSDFAWDPVVAFINIWLAHDAELEARWMHLAGEHGPRWMAHAFYRWHLFSELHADAGPDLENFSVRLWQLTNYGLDVDQLQRVLPYLDGSYHTDAIASDVQHMYRQGWDVYLSSLLSLYGHDTPMMVFEQWHGLRTHGASGIDGESWRRLYMYASCSLLPNRFATTDAQVYVRSYAYMREHFDGVELLELEATLALTGHVPPPDHPRHTALQALFSYSDRCVSGASRFSDDVRRVLYQEHPIHDWYRMQKSLGSNVSMARWLEYYVELHRAIPIQALEMDIA